VIVAASTLSKVLIALAVISAQALDITATQHILGPPYNGQENSFIAHPWVHPNGYAEQWGATLVSDGLQYVITRHWSDNEQAAAWTARAAAHVNAALQIQAQMRAYDAAHPTPAP
jgi:hypothetical protein